ncbi:hypothetical protein HMPREF1212_00452 [Parabacteroides sp. HGS0025]|uniref:DUF6383 domain-containing protein n=1 Tax=Parabacteroides sp. HGS0025 TaxID=1078087 RepID=UPI000616ECEF|nr:DUF6383 domain-containing protein [Parabacteroides sp. HGS0025]KKB52304.1 hypothetical protein HMPREF1212_00452 [Parabacteroides sp. HGS0025]
MNKKFSTLVAALLVAGAWTTLDAKVVTVATPQIGGSYMLGTAASEAGLTGLVAGVSAIKGDAEVAVNAFGNEWILEAAEADGQFYLKQKSSGKYLAGTASAATTELVVDKTVQNVLLFELDGTSFKVAAVTAGTSTATTVAVGNYLQLGGATATEALKCGATSANNIDAVATFEVNKEITLTNFGSQTVNAVEKYNTDDYYFIAQESGYYLNATNETTVAATASLGGITTANLTKALWKVVELDKVNGVYQYKFVNKEYPELYAYITASTNTTFSSTDPYNKGFNLTCGGSAIVANLAAGAAGSEVAVGLYSAPNSVVSATDLNKLLNNGFNLSFKADKDGKITVDYTSAFDGKLKAANETAGAYQIMSGDDYVVLEAATSLTSGITGAKGKFVKVTADELRDNGSKYLSWFQITRNAGKATSAVGTLTVAKASTMVDARYAYIPVAEGKDGKTAVLTTIAAANFKTEEAPIITLSASDMVDFKDLLGQFMSISFVKDEAEAKAKPQDIVYKRNGILSTVQYASDTEAKADYVDNSTVLSNAPEVQWAISSVDEATGLFTLTNRESGKTLEGVSFRKTDKAGEWIVETLKDKSGNEGIIGDVVKVYLFDNKNITMFDGFQTYTPNELRNMVFNIGQYHNETENAVAYWAENHQSNASHQLGVVADTTKATNWALRLDQRIYANGNTNAGKEIANVVDTIFIATPMATYQKGKLVQGAAGDKDVVVSRLAVLPYQFQNKGNLEYVKYATGTNLNYYVCDDKANIEANADRFALKMKPNGFNIVALSGNGTDKVVLTTLGSDKIYAGNSDEWGNLKKVASYTPDDNSIMVVKPIDRPEYRKVAKEWGDIVKIFREEYPTEVLFEKRDAKSVVDKDTLSFLNVNNSVTGANPALFVDTAYVNRVDADGVKNTCYQYLLAVNVNKDDTYHCPLNPLHDTQAWRDEFNGGKPCPDAVENPAMVKGRFLINLIDTAYAYKQDHLHNNPYINMVEADENKAKLSFVEGIHVGDTLYITRKGGEVVKLAMDSPEFNVAKFAFRYVNNAEGSFKIQTQYKEYEATSKEAFEKSADNEGYLRWVNGTVVVTNSYTNGETFNMEENYDGQAVANEDITTSTVKVTTTEGKVIIAGAQGKKVTISNVLGQTVANAVLSSDKAEIATPSGVVIVAVEGEAAVKAIVK